MHANTDTHKTGLKWFFYKHLNAKKVEKHGGFGGGSDLPTGELTKGLSFHISSCLISCLISCLVLSLYLIISLLSFSVISLLFLYRPSCLIPPYHSRVCMRACVRVRVWIRIKRQEGGGTAASAELCCPSQLLRLLKLLLKLLWKLQGLRSCGHQDKAAPYASLRACVRLSRLSGWAPGTRHTVD